MQNTGFPYNSLDVTRQEIRLLTILPAKASGSELQCSLQIVSLNERVNFEALSYAWGSLETQQCLRVNGSPFYVHANLAQALHNLRWRHRPRVVWVDFICIDQHNIEERNSQVLLMSRIYTGANRVVSYLGEPTHNIERAITWSERYVYKKLNKRTLHRWKLDISSWFSAEARRQKELGFIEAHLGIAEIMHLPYWTRMWTYQEYQLPNREPLCLCGNFPVNASAIGKKAKKIRAYIMDVPAYWSNDTMEDMCFTMHTRLRAGMNSLCLGTLLWKTSHHHCSDPRDKVYALYGLVPAVQDRYPPDYNKPLKQIILETTEYIIRNDLQAGIYSRFAIQEDHSLSLFLPSWVPDYTLDSLDWNGPASQYISLKAARSVLEPTANMQPHLSADLSCLHLWGRNAGRCKVLFRLGTTVHQVASQIMKVLENATQLLIAVWSTSNLEKRLVRAFLCHEPRCRDLPAQDMVDALATMTGYRADCKADLVSLVANALNQVCCKTIFLVLTPWGRGFGVTGVDVMDGDVIVLANTALQPLILRERPSLNGRLDERCYQMIGQTFVDGVAEIQTPNWFCDKLQMQPYQEFLVF